jgi:hypothetical protein
MLLILAVALTTPGLRSSVAGVAAGAIAVGFYESYSVALVSLTLVAAMSTGRWRTVLRGAGLMVPAIAVSLVVRVVVQQVTGYVNNAYVESFSDPGSLFPLHLHDLWEAARTGWSAQVVASPSFVQAGPWVTVTFVALALVAGVSVLSHRASRMVRLFSLVGVLLLPVVAALVSEPTPMRAMVYVPLAWLALLVVPLNHKHSRLFGTGLGRALPVVVAALAVMAIASQALIQNRIYAAGEQVLDRDRDLAYQIDQERLRLVDSTSPTPVVVSSAGFGWPANGLTPLVETEGLSLFSGPDWRARDFLLSQGVAVTAPNEDRYSRAEADLASMPVYPQEGWIAYSNGVLLVRLTTDLDR